MEGRGSENKGRRGESDKDSLDEHIEDKCDCCSSLVGDSCSRARVALKQDDSGQ